MGVFPIILILFVGVFSTVKHGKSITPGTDPQITTAVLQYIENKITADRVWVILLMPVAGKVTCLPIKEV